MNNDNLEIKVCTKFKMILGGKCVQRSKCVQLLDKDLIVYNGCSNDLMC